MSWSVQIDHEGCWRGSPLTLTRETRLQAHAAAKDALLTHDTGKSLTITIKETCTHGKQAEYVKAADAYLKAVGNMVSADLGGVSLWPDAYNGIFVARDKLLTCQKCGEAVQ